MHPLLIAGNTFEKNSASKGLLYIDFSEESTSESPFLMYKNTFTKNSGLLGTHVLTLVKKTTYRF